MCLATFWWLLLLLQELHFAAATAADGWVVGGAGESCTAACGTSGRVCTEQGLYEHNSEVDSQAELEDVIGNTCSSQYATNQLTHRTSPNLGDKGDYECCQASGPDRSLSTFSCAAVPSPRDKKRVCYCQGAANTSTSRTTTQSTTFTLTATASTSSTQNATITSTQSMTSTLTATAATSSTQSATITSTQSMTATLTATATTTSTQSAAITSTQSMTSTLTATAATLHLRPQRLQRRLRALRLRPHRA
eukprot:TRINITY_DN6395_c0_g1_i3.p1 TRINITY_DN6395_c0_g1~~TRINITY_DN6395_c0_g1_i3.p1  ORF type:complete len:258 (-),score=0.44 TRINITY_DN6395_c0_g1_i3:54-800(-)